MENNNSVPYIVYESQGARLERAHKRSFILNVIFLIVIISSNLAWYIHESSYETYTNTTTIEATQISDQGGCNYFIGGDNYGTTDNQDNQNDDSTQAEK